MNYYIKVYIDFFFVFYFKIIILLIIFINKMEMNYNNSSDIYEVEKIINCKTYRNKKYYLIKWLCYPISQYTWEPKSNLKNLNYMIEAFESEYPYSIDQDMYNIFCEEVKNKRRTNKKSKNLKEPSNESKFIAKKRKIEYFSDFELNNAYLNKLKKHLYIDSNNYDKIKDIKQTNDEFIIDLSSTEQNEENIDGNSLAILKWEAPEKTNSNYKLILPKFI